MSEEKKENRLEPHPDLLAKAWRKTVLDMAVKAVETRDALIRMQDVAEASMPPGPERDEIVLDWRAGEIAYEKICRTLMAIGAHEELADVLMTARKGSTFTVEPPEETGE